MRIEQLRHRLDQRHDDAGFSMIEMAVAVAVFSIVMVVIFGTVINVMNASNSMKERNQQEADVRLALDTLVREVRQSYTGVTNLDSVEFPASNDTKIIFYSPDRACSGATCTGFRLRKIVYTLTSGTLSRAVTLSNEVSSAVGTATWTFTGQPTVTGNVLTGIRNATVFTYLNQLNAVTTDPDAVRAVQVDLTIDQSLTAPPAAQIFHTQVDLRVTNNGG